ncbi:MFS transporter [Polymorphospora rubra]|uniref:MFS transporter n=1 Tax=Polymorphospora rubra TaxID=338584 RepID=A0A810N4V8_9ACTN|nr:MFS transporter [Polymorphospora rubra]BCJ68771.1 MFS transporter [Polymorphospora rubra]
MPSEITSTLRSIALPVLLPTTLYGIGVGAITPVIVFSARDLGASIGVAGLVAALLGVSQVVGNLPSGRIITRIGERNAMIWAAVVSVAGALACALAPALWVLTVGVVVIGVAGSVWGLARQTYLSETVPYVARARAMSTLGGVNRIGYFLGPFIGAAVMQWTGTDGAYWVFVVAVAAAGTAALTLPDVTAGPVRRGAPDVGLLAVLRTSLPLLRTLGVAAVLVGAVRGARQVALPLWADHLGLDPTTASLIYGAAAAMDMLLFYPAGKVMDTYGRRWIGVPSMLVLGLTHLALPLTSTVASLTAVALLMGLGNGIGSGVMMTIGADIAPPEHRATFLGAWRLCNDLGGSAGPLLVGVLGTVGALGAGIAGMGLVGLAGAAALHRWTPPHRPRT